MPDFRVVPISVVNQIKARDQTGWLMTQSDADRSPSPNSLLAGN